MRFRPSDQLRKSRAGKGRRAWSPAGLAGRAARAAPGAPRRPELLHACPTYSPSYSQVCSGPVMSLKKGIPKRWPESAAPELLPPRAWGAQQSEDCQAPDPPKQNRQPTETHTVQQDHPKKSDVQVEGAWAPRNVGLSHLLIKTPLSVNASDLEQYGSQSSPPTALK